MPRGVTNQPLVIHVADEWYARPEILALMRQGHQIHNMNKVTSGNADLIIHPAAGWTVELLEPEKRENGSPYWPYLDAGIARARARRRKK